ncbi:3-deoxy-7-phosphoheptulonate synthase [Tuwongella immobilis]|uniref:Phospho-2-dehydro-3-deoxyheptonate aldolase n=1 Tax=Tuwongella immobilis TaxID=692036 RepID=A0A6C2YNK3_9BACT|nr:3-deoxy-7-phosphoheptulonate synthase [Tuwongella immobilis]VIP02635.1 phospho-2-dehydro-3-deoxyheptonate aldolase : Phospho-2-dehydro-3-deoxyheptonate aldolase OS=Planctomyces maris DSM 8797 GN=PM8797T_08909 PE=3 SV=1: DAHP_synth_1 [Tuwongella immobilis]VTS01993.1 phospho-2-dehydro-3-deoxyheptonate aldolase : Phospho-2-dehydro-3-deoxyheptonate aldolase OS=Planctomyces maris DSM 8797 GN=PM8797T_08909 PE=3 SV=1: DAHP_synth_1 [Tuwongella immobilis]
MQPTKDLNVQATIPLIPPCDLMEALPMSEAANRTVVAGREDVKRIIRGDDKRLLIVVGPCSIHDPDAAMEYAARIKQLADDVNDRLQLVMRVYFEKPRTTVGWKGLINDPHLNDTFDVASGLKIARRLLNQVNELGMPVATEMLEPITPQYIADLVTLASIGARTTESPTHRQMASGLSMPVGYKNGTDGSLQVAIDAMLSARQPHAFVGIDSTGRTCIVQTKGNSWGHVILRGGRSGTNYSREHLLEAARKLESAGLPPRLMIDCSHANSEKDYRKQSTAWRDVLRQRIEGNEAIFGLMLESNLVAGAQKLVDPCKLQYGVSITDGCIGWEETEQLIREAYEQFSPESSTSANGATANATPSVATAQG